MNDQNGSSDVFGHICLTCAYIKHTDCVYYINEISLQECLIDEIRHVGGYLTTIEENLLEEIIKESRVFMLECIDEFSELL